MKPLSIVLALLLCFSTVVWANDDNRGMDHSKGHSNDGTHSEKPPKPPSVGVGGDGGNGGGGGNGGQVGTSNGYGGAGGSATATGGNGYGGNGYGGSVSGSGNSTNNNTLNNQNTLNNTLSNQNSLSNTQSQGQTQTANSTASSNSSSNAALTNSGNSYSGIDHSGNSQSSAYSGVEGSGNSQSASAASNNGNGSNNTTINNPAPKIPVATAFAPTAIPTVNCFKGYGGAVQTMSAGVSLGGGKVDKNCQILETARSFALSGSRKAYCKTMITTDAAKKAGVTFEDCMYEEPPAVIPQAAPAPAPSPAVKIFVAPVAPVPVPEYKNDIAVTPEQLLGVCTFGSNVQCNVGDGTSKTADVVAVSKVCKQMLDAAQKAVERNPGSSLLVRGYHTQAESEMTATARAFNVRKELLARGTKAAIAVETKVGAARTVELYLEPPVETAASK